MTGLPIDRLTRLHLSPRTGTRSLVGSAKTDEEYAEAIALWTGILAKAGIRTGAPTFQHGVWSLPYETGDGTVIREFMANAKQFKPKDEQALSDNKAMILGELRKRGLPVLASYELYLDFMLPTYSVYYLTREEKRREDELQVRVLKPGDDIDTAVFERAGVSVLQKPESWIMVYLGREVGFVTRAAKTREDAEKRVQQRVAELTAMGKVMIETRIEPLTDPFQDYHFWFGLYFYQ